MQINQRKHSLIHVNNSAFSPITKFYNDVIEGDKKFSTANYFVYGYEIIISCIFFFRDRYCSNTSNLSIQKMLIVCAIYYSVIPNSCTGFGNWICVAPKAFLNFSMFFFFLGWKWEGCRLSLSLVTKSTRTLSDALWEPHISILSHFIWHFNFYHAARVRGKKKNKEKQVQF